MQRREFITSGLLSVAAASTLGPLAAAGDQAREKYREGQKITLANHYLEWDLVMTGGTMQSSGFRNKLTGHSYTLKDSNEFRLTFSQARMRVEIPWWNLSFGQDDDHTPPDQEKGYLQGYHLEDLAGEDKWDKTQNPLLRNGERVTLSSPATFKGYAWFRQQFELPAEARGEPIVFCLGGYNQEDWNEYWIYVHGNLIGHWTSSGFWRVPKEWAVQPGSAAYQLLRFGAGQKNLLAIRTYQFEKLRPGVPEQALDHCTFQGRLYDQFISVGQPYRHISDFKLDEWRQEAGGERPHYVFQLSNTDEQLQLTLHYELDEFMRRKWLEVKNAGTRPRLLLDVNVDDFRLDASLTPGDYGQPVIIGEELFAALEHPAGVNQGMNDRLLVRHFPGKTLEAGGSFRSKVSVIGVAPQGAGEQQFVDYIAARSPRQKLLSIYDPLGINGFPDEPCWTLNDKEMLTTLDLMEKWQKQGVKFDYFVPDVGWIDRAGDLTRFWPQCFPEGPGKVVKRVNELGMKWGLWFSGTWADWGNGENPKIAASRTLVAGGKWPEDEYRDGFHIDDNHRMLCLASEPYFSMLRDALLYHIRTYNLRFFKLDVSSCYCNRMDHPHLPGKYSTEAAYDAVLEIARVTRQASPDLYIMWYWGYPSPFFGLHGDSIFDRQFKLEASSAADYPVLFFRDGISLALDQAVQYAKFVPPILKDSLGIFITDTWLANSIRTERWREAAIMDLGRGNLLFPQIWGDLRMLSDDDVAFLARTQKLAKENEALLHNQKRILGDPWKNEVYGYAYFEGMHGFLFVNNASFEARQVSIRFDEKLGMKAAASGKLRLFSHFPEQAEIQWNGKATFARGETIDTWLRPFEVALWEVVADPSQVARKGFAPRELPTNTPDVQSRRLNLDVKPIGPGLDLPFGDTPTTFRSILPRPALDELKLKGFEKRIIARQVKLPDKNSGLAYLAVTLKLRKGSKPWRYDHLADLIQTRALIDDELIELETVPNFRQTLWADYFWIVFRTRIVPTWFGKTLKVGINAYLPPEVESQEEAWIVPEWWT